MFFLWEDNDETLQFTSTHWDVSQPDTQLCAARSPQTTHTTGCERSKPRVTNG